MQRRGPKGWERSDERIKEDLCERLSQSDDVDPSEITVEVHQGVVTLDGTVIDRWMRYTLEDLADSVSGVKDVQNNVRLAREDQGSSQSGTSSTGSGSSRSSGGSLTGSGQGSSTGYGSSGSSGTIGSGSSSGSGSGGSSSTGGSSSSTRTKE